MTARPSFGRDSFANYILIGSYQLGHTIYSGENGSISVDVDPDTMRRLWDNFYVPYISGYYLEEGRFRSDDLKTGKLIAYVGSSSGAVYAPDQVTYDDGSTETIRCDILRCPALRERLPAQSSREPARLCSARMRKRKSRCHIFKMADQGRKQYPILYGIRISSGNKSCQ